MPNPWSVDRDVASVKALREISRRISTRTEKWWIEEDLPDGTILGYSGSHHVSPPQKALFSFPKVAHVSLFGEDGEIVCCYPMTAEPYPRGELNALEDWERLWQPLAKAIAQRYSALEQRQRRDEATYGLLHWRERQAVRPEKRRTLHDCLQSDGQLLRKGINRTLLRSMLCMDSVVRQPHEVLQNETGFIRDGQRFVKSFRKLLRKGCKVVELAGSLGYFQSYQEARATPADMNPDFRLARKCAN